MGGIGTMGTGDQGAFFPAPDPQRSPPASGLEPPGLTP